MSEIHTAEKAAYSKVDHAEKEQVEYMGHVLTGWQEIEYMRRVPPGWQEVLNGPASADLKDIEFQINSSAYPFETLIYL
ncbi:unnamed protein product [Acanthoscelides obtectus]|uniref:Uncharacterized protein n=1 Tax=Acanthoscelides obtectus TaxID=200917 RepID=A0A9P0PNQ2_ACAOB|nr:unnamed protein product [Acanthoscelides obtectus]CAK1680693.1 hypothetical protein AOBTE_LOCUS32843 [Acanthoscelides obtectus]